MALNDPQKPLTSQDELRDRLAERRLSLSSKVEALETEIEGRVLASIDRLTSDIEQTVHHVTDSVRDSITKLKTSVDVSIEGVLDGVTQSVDVKAHYQQRPLAMFALSIFAGAFATRLFASSSARDEPKNFH